VSAIKRISMMMIGVEPLTPRRVGRRISARNGAATCTFAVSRLRFRMSSLKV
jgi:hypothetical protein